MLRALLLLVALGLAGVAAIPLAGHLVGVQLMADAVPRTGAEPVVLLQNNFIVALVWLAGWLTLALLCIAAAVALDQQHRALRLLRQQPREAAARPAPASEAPAPQRPAPRPAPRPSPREEPSFEPRPAARSEPQLRPRPVEEPRPQPRGPVLRADR